MPTIPDQPNSKVVTFYTLQMKRHLLTSSPTLFISLRLVVWTWNFLIFPFSLPLNHIAFLKFCCVYILHYLFLTQNYFSTFKCSSRQITTPTQNMHVNMSAHTPICTPSIRKSCKFFSCYRQYLVICLTVVILKIPSTCLSKERQCMEGFP